MLQFQSRKYYKVKEGQTLREVAQAFSVAEGRLVELNGIKEELFTGQILQIPPEQGNVYYIQEGDSKQLLCGSEENYRKKNGTDVFYIGMRVII